MLFYNRVKHRNFLIYWYSLVKEWKNKAHSSCGGCYADDIFIQCYTVQPASIGTSTVDWFSNRTESKWSTSHGWPINHSWATIEHWTVWTKFVKSWFIKINLICPEGIAEIAPVYILQNNSNVWPFFIKWVEKMTEWVMYMIKRTWWINYSNCNILLGEVTGIFMFMLEKITFKIKTLIVSSYFQIKVVPYNLSYILQKLHLLLKFLGTLKKCYIQTLKKQSKMDIEIKSRQFQSKTLQHLKCKIIAMCLLI